MSSDLGLAADVSPFISLRQSPNVAVLETRRRP
jgi:hypothetical protein